MNRVVFRISPKATVYITLLVAGLLVFVYLHWRGQRQVELIVFLVLTLLAATLYTIRGELALSPTSRKLTGKRTWLGWPVRTIIVRVGPDDALHLTEDLTHGKGNQGISVSHRLEASGELVSHRSNEPGPYILLAESHVRNRARLEEFAENAAKTLGVPLEDSRRFTERVGKHRQSAD